MRRQIEKAKQFVKDHPTATACVVTAVVSWKISHTVTIKGVLEETSQLAYRWGRENVETEIELFSCLEFIDHKNLVEEFTDFANRGVRQNIANQILNA